MITLAGHVVNLFGFHVTMIRWCSLHTLNLGPMVWSAGGALELCAEWASGLCSLVFPLISKNDCYHLNQG